MRFRTEEQDKRKELGSELKNKTRERNKVQN